MSGLPGRHSISLPEAVVKQAWEDAFTTAPDRMSLPDHINAWLFLTAETGEWQESREDWCVAAGLCPNKLRTNALRNVENYRAHRIVVEAAAKIKTARGMKYVRNARARAREDKEAA